MSSEFVRKPISRRKRCKAFEVGDRRLAVFNIGGKFYVTDDECTHASASLADGMLDGDVIECAVHMGAFHVPTGAVKAPPCSVALRTYKVVLQGRRCFRRSRPRRGRRAGVISGFAPRRNSL